MWQALDTSQAGWCRGGLQELGRGMLVGSEWFPSGFLAFLQEPGSVTAAAG